jgi:hypothetical protein
VLLLDRLGEPLALQGKGARPSALLPDVAGAGFHVKHSGHAMGERRIARAAADAGGQRVPVGAHGRGRRCVPGQAVQEPQGQRRPGALAPGLLEDYGRMTGALPTRAHAHSADPRLIAGYCGKS